MGSVEGLLERVLDRGYNGVATRVLRAVAGSVTGGQVGRDLDVLEAEARRLDEAGERLTVENPAVRAVLGSLDLAMRDNVVRLRDAGGELQTVGIEAARTLSRQLALPGMSDEQLRALGIGWVEPDVESVARLVELVDSEAFGDALAGLSEDVVGVVRNQAIRGVIYGWSPLRISQEMRRLVRDYPQVMADTMMRTLQLESYRSGTAVYQNANSGIIRRVIRVEVLDNRICLACTALHGTVVWDGEANAGQPIPKISEHRNGRGTTIVETVVRPVTIETGVDWFARQPEARRRALAGGAAFNALEDGAVQLSDFVVDETDPLFGAMIREDSLRGILGEGANRYYVRNQ